MENHKRQLCKEKNYLPVASPVFAHTFRPPYAISVMTIATFDVSTRRTCIWRGKRRAVSALPSREHHIMPFPRRKYVRDPYGSQ